MEPFTVLPQFGRFIIRDEGKTVGIGVITKVSSKRRAKPAAAAGGAGGGGGVPADSSAPKEAPPAVSSAAPSAEPTPASTPNPAEKEKAKEPTPSPSPSPSPSSSPKPKASVPKVISVGKPKAQVIAVKSDEPDLEKAHENRYKRFVENIEDGSVFKKADVITWKCGNCGNLYVGKSAPDVCPMCNHPQGHYRKLDLSYM